jgi:hypothetical protein
MRLESLPPLVWLVKTLVSGARTYRYSSAGSVSTGIKQHFLSPIYLLVRSLSSI